jgi:hypothetical protein
VALLAGLIEEGLSKLAERSSRSKALSGAPYAIGWPV